MIVVVLVVAGVASAVAAELVGDRARREAQEAVDLVGTPPGFRRTGASTTGSAFCFGPCLRRHVRYATDLAVGEAVAQVVVHLRARGGTKSCSLDSRCDEPLRPEDCSAVTDGPTCLLVAIVKGRTVFLSVSRHGPPTELTVTAGPKEDLNLLF